MRKIRLFLSDYCYHVTMRCNEREFKQRPLYPAKLDRLLRTVHAHSREGLRLDLAQSCKYRLISVW